MHTTGTYDLLRDHFKNTRFLERISRGQDNNARKINLSRNTNPLALNTTQAQYPAPQHSKLLQEMSHTYGVNASNIVIPHGGEGAIDKAIQLFCEPAQDSILTHSPTFFGYSEFAKFHNVNIVDCPLEKQATNHKLDTLRFIETALNPDNNVKLSIICSPNNPTGDYFDHEQILTIAKALEGKSALLIDEAYIEISGKKSFTSQFNNVSNVMILRTLSKAYGLANLRTGALLFNDSKAAYTFRQLPRMYPTTDDIAKIAASAVQSETAILNHRFDIIRRHANDIYNHLTHSDHIWANKPHANFVFFQTHFADQLETHLNNAGISIATPDFTQSPNGFRVSVGLEMENEKFMQAISNFQPH